MRDPVQTIGKLIDKQKTAFIGSVDAAGFPEMKAMLAPRRREGIKVFYLTTNTSAMRTKRYRENPKACMYFCDQRYFCGVMLKGSMEVSEDADDKALIWRDGDVMYYPKGVSDPDYCVLRFTAESGRYYSKFKSEDFLVE